MKIVELLQEAFPKGPGFEKHLLSVIKKSLKAIEYSEIFLKAMKERGATSFEGVLVTVEKVLAAAASTEKDVYKNFAVSFLITISVDEVLERGEMFYGGRNHAGTHYKGGGEAQVVLTLSFELTGKKVALTKKLAVSDKAQAIWTDKEAEKLRDAGVASEWVGGNRFSTKSDYSRFSNARIGALAKVIIDDADAAADDPDLHAILKRDHDSGIAAANDLAKSHVEKTLGKDKLEPAPEIVKLLNSKLKNHKIVDAIKTSYF